MSAEMLGEMVTLLSLQFQFQFQDLLSVSLAKLLVGSPLKFYICRQAWKSLNLNMPYVKREELSHFQGLLTHRNIILRDTG